jgi:hypothetical protein
VERSEDKHDSFFTHLVNLTEKNHFELMEMKNLMGQFFSQPHYLSVAASLKQTQPTVSKSPSHIRIEDLPEALANIGVGNLGGVTQQLSVKARERLAQVHGGGTLNSLIASNDAHLSAPSDMVVLTRAVSTLQQEMHAVRGQLNEVLALLRSVTAVKSDGAVAPPAFFNPAAANADSTANHVTQTYKEAVDAEGNTCTLAGELIFNFD